jgi:hypothetical protein
MGDRRALSDSRSDLDREWDLAHHFTHSDERTAELRSVREES